MNEQMTKARKGFVRIVEYRLKGMKYKHTFGHFGMFYYHGHAVKQIEYDINYGYRYDYLKGITEINELYYKIRGIV